MIKKIFFLLFVASAMVACNNPQQSGETKTTEDQTQKAATEVTVANFEQMAGDLVGQEIIIKGLVNHTCKHSGKRMFIVADETDESIEIVTGENIDSFDAELEGSDVIVNGIVTELRVDETYLAEWEAEIMSEDEEEAHKIHDGNHEGDGHDHKSEGHDSDGEDHHEEGHDGDGHDHDGEANNEHSESDGEGENMEEEHHGSGLEQIADLRNMLKESGKDHLSFYSIECISFEVAPPPPPTAE